MRQKRRAASRGFTLIELTVNVAAMLIIAMSTGALLGMAKRLYNGAMAASSREIEHEAFVATWTLQRMGRQANRSSYTLYDVENGAFTPSQPVSGPAEQVVPGDAVEFRYWDVPLDQDDTHDLLDASKIATAYTLFYLDGGDLKVDYGPYPPGAITGGARNTGGVTTVTLARAVEPDPAAPGIFSHYLMGTTGHACVRMNIVLTDPCNAYPDYHLSTAVLIRNVWPR